MAVPQFHRLPSVERVAAAMCEANSNLDHPVAVAAARETLASARRQMKEGGPPPTLAEIVDRAAGPGARRQSTGLTRVINATGVILQTNLGRAPLSNRARNAAEAAAGGYTNLEFDLQEGERGSRHAHLRGLLQQATGAEDGIVVNNNAAALFMVLRVFASGREVIVSRGQAVEIGGGFRIPDVLRESGARLVEVGTTNRTYARDYEAAVTTESSAILRVHTSNFRVVGFTAQPGLDELSRVACGADLLLLDDLGSGCLVDTRRYGMAAEPTVQDSLRAGANLVLFSGDKLLGGPQAGIIVGEGGRMATLRAHPLARALRVDKLTIAALGATLEAYIAGTEEQEIPVWRMVASSAPLLKRRASRWARVAGERGRVVASRSMIGGGSLPGEGVHTWCVALTVSSPLRFTAALRRESPAIVARVADRAVLLDPRTVDPADDGLVADSLSRTLGREES